MFALTADITAEHNAEHHTYYRMFPINTIASEKLLTILVNTEKISKTRRNCYNSPKNIKKDVFSGKNYNYSGG